MTRASRVLAFAILASMTGVHAREPQSLSAQVGDIAFASGDDGILLVPLDDGSFNLSASTQGASDWPPPKTRIDRLAITCAGLKPGQPLKLAQKDFADRDCNVVFEKGTHPMGAEPEESYHLDKASADNRFEITTAHGATYSGTFAFRLLDANGTAVPVKQGRFTVEDRQIHGM